MSDGALLDAMMGNSGPIGDMTRGKDTWRPRSPPDSRGSPEPSGRAAGPNGVAMEIDAPVDVGRGAAKSGKKKATGNWDIVRKRVVNAVGATLGFRTLRDMYGDFILDPEKMTFVKTLGEGTHGRVDKYTYTDETGTSCLAVKKLSSSMVSAQDMLDFVREVELLKKLAHECIATYRGSGTLPADEEGQEEDLYLATECLEGGTLRDVLVEQMQAKHSTDRKYTLLQAAHWMLDVARGMAYLHNSEPVVIHRDLKLENIMLNGEGRAKIVDFGLHKVIDRWLREYVQDAEGLYEMSGGMGAYIYMAPESLTSNRYNHLVDVYAFGIILWELMHYEMLIDRVSLHGTTDDLKNFAKFVSREAWRPPVSSDLPVGIVNLIEDCWSQRPSDRPEFRDIISRLRDVIADMKADGAEDEKMASKEPSIQSTTDARDANPHSPTWRRWLCFCL